MSMQFIAGLLSAGVTSEEMKKLPDHPDLQEKVAKFIKELVADEPPWGPSYDYAPSLYNWTPLAPDVRVRVGRYGGLRDVISLRVSVRDKNCCSHCKTMWPSTTVELDYVWMDIAPGIQVRRSEKDLCVAVRWHQLEQTAIT